MRIANQAPSPGPRRLMRAPSRPTLSSKGLCVITRPREEGHHRRFGVRQLAAAFPGRELARAASLEFPTPASKLA